MAGIEGALPWLAPAMQRLGSSPQNFPMSKRDQVTGLKSEFDRIVASISEAEARGGAAPGTGRMLGRLMDINEEIAGLAADPIQNQENNIAIEEDAARETAERMRTDPGELDRGDQTSAFSDYGDSHEMSRLAEQAAGEQTLGGQTLAPWVSELLPDTLQSGPRVGPGIDPNSPDQFKDNPLQGLTDRPAPGIAPADLASPAPQQAEQISARPMPGTVTDDVRSMAAGGTQRYPGSTGHGVQGMLTPAPSPDPAMRGAGVFDPQSQKPNQVEPGAQQADPGFTRNHPEPVPGMQFLQGPRAAAQGGGQVSGPLPGSQGLDIPSHALQNPMAGAMFGERQRGNIGPSPSNIPAPAPASPNPFTDPFAHQQSQQGLGVEFDPTPEGLNDLAAEATQDPGYLSRMTEAIERAQGSPEGMTGEIPRFLAAMATSGQRSESGQPWRDTEAGIAFTRSKPVQALEDRMRVKGVRFDPNRKQYIQHDNPKAAALLDEYQDVQQQILSHHTDNVVNEPGDFKPQDSGYERMQALQATKDRLARILQEEGIDIPSDRETADTGQYDPNSSPSDINAGDENLDIESMLSEIESLMGDEGAEMRPSEDEEGIKHPTQDQKAVIDAGHGIDAEYRTILPSVHDKGNKAVFEAREANADLKTADQRSLADRGAADSAFSWATGKPNPENVAEIESRDVSIRASEWLNGDDKILAALVETTKKLPALKEQMMSKTFDGTNRHRISAQASKVQNFIYGSNGLFEKAKQAEANLRQIARDAIASGDNETAMAALAQARDSMLQRQSILQHTRRDINPRTRHSKAAGMGDATQRGEALGNQNYRTKALSPPGWEKEALELTKALYGPGYSADQKAREAELRLENTPSDFSAGEGYRGKLGVKPAEAARGSKTDEQFEDTYWQSKLGGTRAEKTGEVVRQTIPNPRYDSLERERDANRQVSKTVSEHRGRGLMAELRDLGVETYVPQGATAAEIEPSVTGAQAREAEPRKALVSELQESISNADPKIVLHHAETNEELGKMFEQMRHHENSKAHLSPDPIPSSDKNPLGFKHPTTAAVANDMVLALERGQSPSETFQRFMRGKDRIPETGRVKMSPVDYKTSTQKTDRPAPKGVTTKDMLIGMSNEMGSDLLSEEEIQKMTKAQHARCRAVHETVRRQEHARLH